MPVATAPAFVLSGHTSAGEVYGFTFTEETLPKLLNVLVRWGLYEGLGLTMGEAESIYQHACRMVATAAEQRCEGR